MKKSRCTQPILAKRVISKERRAHSRAKRVVNLMVYAENAVNMVTWLETVGLVKEMHLKDQTGRKNKLGI